MAIMMCENNLDLEHKSSVLKKTNLESLGDPEDLRAHPVDIVYEGIVIKPCPICKGLPEIRVYEKYGDIEIACTQCGLMLDLATLEDRNPDTEVNNVEQLIEFWNNRKNKVVR